MDEDNNIITHSLFEDIYQSLKDFSDNVLDDKLDNLVRSLANEYDCVTIEGIDYLSHYDDLDNVCIESSTSEGKYLRSNFDEVMRVITNYDRDDITLKLNHAYHEIAFDRIRDSVKTDDVMIVETINSLEEIEESTGKFIERLREWCTSYVPELDKLSNHELYARIIRDETSRDNIKNSTLLEATGIELSDSYDVYMSDEDLVIIKKFADDLCNLYDTRAMLEEFIQEKVRNVAPNLHDVAGANLAAKLIAHIHGLENLAKLPSSTVQILGAEKATFRHLKTGERPPKHGLIFQHPLIRGSNWWVRGKISRAVANKISIATRMDAFGHQYDESLRKDLESSVEKIKKDHPFVERRRNKKKSDDKRKNKKDRKDKRRKSKRNKMKLRKGDYSY
ncbi:MAG: hypothetical protein BZ136_05350 [Methanosphaera sp. rholeuAM74]|nr:MAG: hypothetical protein BZ136_05350 [Methanosphaera sp. rholeuAM74]